MMFFVVVATERDAAASWIANGKLFAVVDNNSLFADFDGQVPREKTVDLRNHAFGGDWSSAEHASKSSARICTLESCCTMASPCSKGLVSVRRRNAT